MCCSISNDDSWILSGSRDSTLRIWNKQGKCLHILKGHGHWVNNHLFLSSKLEVNCCEIAHDDSWILSSSWDSTLRIWDRNGNCLNVLEDDIQLVRVFCY